MEEWFKTFGNTFENINPVVKVELIWIAKLFVDLIIHYLNVSLFDVFLFVRVDRNCRSIALVWTSLSGGVGKDDITWGGVRR